MKKMLLHSCCGPCSSGVIEQLVNDYDITILFYNPNIHPDNEYKKRLDAQKKLVDSLNAEGYNIKLIECEYNPEEYFNMIKGFEYELEGGKRCEECFRLRLEYSAKFAKNNGYDIFTTTMSVSPHKDYILLNQIGEEMSNKYGVDCYFANFKKNNGYLNSIRNSQKYDLYRQDYCGCVYSNWHMKK